MVFEVKSPLLLVVFREKAQLAKVMGIAQSVLTLGLLRRATVAIVFSHSVKLEQDVDLIGGDLASLAMRCVVRISGQSCGCISRVGQTNELHLASTRVSSIRTRSGQGERNVYAKTTPSDVLVIGSHFLSPGVSVYKPLWPVTH